MCKRCDQKYKRSSRNRKPSCPASKCGQIDYKNCPTTKAIINGHIVLLAPVVKLLCDGERYLRGDKKKCRR